MDAQLREQKLQEIQSKDPVTKKRMIYKDQSVYMGVYEIPIEFLIFNKHNGRIGTYVKTYEKQYGPIDATTDPGKNQIVDFLWKSKVGRNKETLEDIKKNGQLEIGIVTRDGVIIDGNRRCMLLEKLKKNYFTAVILDDTLEDNPNEIRRLETKYQMGIDEKVDYNAIEKYLKCKDLSDGGFSEDEIAAMMGEKPSEIKKYLEILRLMEDYLNHYGYGGMYTLLDEETVEGPFVDLCQYLKKHETGSPQKRDWEPNKEDIDDLRNVYFDYIRAGFRTSHDIRNIGNTSKGKGFFSNKKIWDGFFEEYEEKIETINDKEKSFEEWRADRPGEPIEDIIKGRNRDWEEKVGTPKSDGSKMNTLLKYTSRKLEDIRAADSPMELLKRAKSTLEAVNTEVASFEGKDVREISHAIRKLAEDFIKIVDQRAKS